MQKILSAIISVVLIFGIMSSSVIVGSAAALDNTDSASSQQEVSNNLNDISIKSTNSFGNLLTSEIDDNLSKQNSNNGCKIFSVDVKDNQATVDFETIKDCSLVVAVYEEDGIKMLASGDLEVKKEDKQAIVTIDTNNMPEYFYLKAYLVDSKEFRPLSTVYESPNYTKEMQEFFAKTTDDFSQDKVLNLDEDKTNNFAVYGENTKIIPKSETENKVSSVDDNKGVYVIKNADSNITSLKEGDIFSYNYNDNDFLIVKVKSISINGTTATITGDETSMEEVFDYVKIDSKAVTGDDKTKIDPSTCEEGVIYNGLVNENKSRSSVSTYSLEVSGGVSATPVSLKFVDKKIGDDDNYAKISGGIEHKIELSIKLYISWTYSYFELKLDNTTSIDVTVSGKATGQISFPSFCFAPVPGLYIEMTPSFIISVDGKVILKGTLQSTTGFKVSTDKGLELTFPTPKFKAEIKAEVTVFLGLSLKPKIKVIDDRVLEAKLEAVAGVEIKAECGKSVGESDEKIHECKNCIQGEINFKLSISAEAKFLNLEKLKFEAELLNFTCKICDFYYSFDFNEFAFTTCPHYKYKVLVLCSDENGKPINNVEITAGGEDYFTGEKCAATLYLPKENIKITAQKDNKLGEYNLNVDEYYSNDDYFDERFNQKMIKIILNEKNYWRDVSLGLSHSAAITRNGDLYLWGNNFYGQVGYGTNKNVYTPQKIMSDVLSVSLGCEHSAAITKNGDLYVWGRNDSGEVGDGTTEHIYTPKKIMSNVASVSLGTHSAAITKNGDLYMWGYNYHGQIGDGTTNNIYTPKKIMSNVASVSLGSFHSAAITENGDLYVWGLNSDGQVGDGTYQDIYTPKKIMSDIISVSVGHLTTGAINKYGELYTWGQNPGDKDNYRSTKPIKIMSNVAYVSLGDYNGAVITRNRDLYMWGDNRFGELGDGTTTYSDVPKKIMSDVYFVSLGNACSSAITTNKNLYTWGNNCAGQLGDGTTTDRYTPTLITIPSKTATSTTNTQAATSAQIPTKVSSVKAVATTKTRNFSSLIPNDVYNFYSVKIRDTYEPLDTGNLLYITQAKADENGNLSITYDTAKEYDSDECFVVAMDRIDISNATIEVDNLTENGEEQFVNPTVKLDNKTLTFGIDYEIAGDYSAKEIGEYTIKIIGIGDYKGTAEAKYKVLCDYERTPLVNNSTISATKITLGDTIKLTASATGGTAPYKYKYYCKPEGDKDWTALTGSTTSTSFSHKPARTISYQYAVKIADANGKIATKYFTVNVSKPLQNTSTISATNITLGDTITLTASATGGTAPYKYKYYCKPEGDSSWTALTDTTTDSTFTKKPARAISYEFAVKIADANGKIATKYFTVNVSKPLQNTSTISATNITLGDTITLTASATGGTAPYKYKYYCKPEGDSSWTALTDTTTDSTFTKKPARAISYEFAVKIADANGKIATKYFIVNVMP